MKVSELTGTKPPKILMYGEVGCGKTALALTAGASAQVLDFEEGLNTGITLKDKFTPDRLQVDVVSFIEALPHKQATVFAKAKQYIYTVSEQCVKGTFPYKVLVIDSLSSLAEAAVNQILGNSGRLGKAPEIQHWGLAFIEIENVLSVLRTLPIVVIMIAHEQIKTIGDENRLQIAISGKNLPTKVTRYFDEVWYMRARPAGAGAMKYTVQTKNNGLIAARSRGNLPDHTDTSVGIWELMAMIGYKPQGASK